MTYLEINVIMNQQTLLWERMTYEKCCEKYFVYIFGADICSILPDVSPTTVEAVLSKMVRNGQIKKIGQSRMTRYVKA